MTIALFGLPMNLHGIPNPSPPHILTLPHSRQTDTEKNRRQAGQVIHIPLIYPSMPIDIIKAIV